MWSPKFLFFALVILIVFAGFGKSGVALASSRNPQWGGADGPAPDDDTCFT